MEREPNRGDDGPLRACVAVLVVGRNDLIRRGLSSIAERGGLRVVGECRTPESGTAMLRRMAADVAVVDAEPEDTASTALADLAAACPLLVLVPDGDMDSALGALLAGARGCVARSSVADVLLAELHVAAHGETVIPRLMVDELLRSVTGRPAADGANGTGGAAAVRERLTAREAEVLGLVVRGWDNAQIGAALYISPRTVKNHIASILGKLEVQNRLQAAVFAVRCGLDGPPLPAGCDVVAPRHPHHGG